MTRRYSEYSEILTSLAISCGLREVALNGAATFLQGETVSVDKMVSTEAGFFAQPHKCQKWIYKIKTLLIDQFNVSNVAFNVTQIHLVDLAVTFKC